MIDAPLAFAFAAGMVAAFNPCGFAMLPAYLAYFVGLEDGTASSAGAAAHLRRAVAVGAVVSAGFVLVFAAAGLLVARFSLSVQEYAPWLTVPIGVVLVLLGLATLWGVTPKVALPRLEKGTRGRGLVPMFLFGVSYATVSLSCTLPVFLVAVSGVFVRSDLASGVAVLGTYALGMGLVVVASSIAVGLARRSAVRRLRNVVPHVGRASGALVVVAGAYVTYYGYHALRLGSGAGLVAAGPVGFVSGLSGAVSDWVQRTGAARIGVALAAATAATAVLAGLARRPADRLRVGAGEGRAKDQARPGAPSGVGTSDR